MKLECAEANPHWIKKKQYFDRKSNKIRSDHAVFS